MFGFIKKYVDNLEDAKRTTDQCIELWDKLSPVQRGQLAGQILKICTLLLRDRGLTKKQAFDALRGYKHEVIRMYNLKNHMHPDFMQFQLLMDLVYTSSLDDKSSFYYTLDVITEIARYLDDAGQDELRDCLNYVIDDPELTI